MLVVHVDIHVKQGYSKAFSDASLANAQASINEPGIFRFDVIQDNEDPNHFVLVEIYRTPEAVAAHKATPHYTTWATTVAPMMAEPRKGTKFTNLFPQDEAWR